MDPLTINKVCNLKVKKKLTVIEIKCLKKMSHPMVKIRIIKKKKIKNIKTVNLRKL